MIFKFYNNELSFTMRNYTKIKYKYKTKHIKNVKYTFKHEIAVLKDNK